MQLSKPNYQVFSTILLGFLLFGLKDFAGLISAELPSIIAFVGLFFIFTSPLWFKYKRLSTFKGNVKILFYFYLFWIGVIILQPLFNGQGYSDKSIHPYAIFGLTSYLLPFIVFLGVNNISLNKIFRIIFVFSLIGFVFFVVNFDKMISIVLVGEGISLDGEMGIGDLANKYYFWFNISSLSLLCYEFVTKKYKWVAIITSIFLFLLMLYFARRGGIFMCVLYFIGMFYLYLEQSKSNYRFPKIVLFYMLFYLAYEFVNIYSNSIFELIFSRSFEDSRSSVDESLIEYLNTENAWLFGKGIEGAYIHSDFDLPRYNHETGYLYLILKGGITYLFFYVFLLSHAAYIGFFKTRNRFTKALALYCFFHVVFLIPYGLPFFSLEYLFLWIAFALCESTKFRVMSNEQVKQYLANN